MKPKALLIGMLVASPAAVYWGGRIGLPPATAPASQSVFPNDPGFPVAESTVRIPVEVIAAGSEPEWIYVQVPK